jgi:hypothetical protein
MVTGKYTVWTGDMLLDRALADIGFKREHLERALTRNVEALDAETPSKTLRLKNGAELVTEGAPDWPNRLRASENLFGLVGFKGKRERDGTGDKPVQVTINLSAPAPRAELPPGRLEIHLSGNGHANGDAPAD